MKRKIYAVLSSCVDSMNHLQSNVKLCATQEEALKFIETTLLGDSNKTYHIGPNNLYGNWSLYLTAHGEWHTEVQEI